HAFQRIGRTGYAGRLPQLAAMDSDEGRAEAVEAGEILIAGGLVDAPFAAELGLDRLHGDAVRLDPAIAAALADELVDDDALVGIGEGAALAATPLLGRAGLVVEQHRDALHLAQIALHGVEIVAVMDARPGRKLRLAGI